MKMETKILFGTMLFVILGWTAMENIDIHKSDRFEIKQVEDTTVIIQKEPFVCTQESVYDMILIAGIDHPKVVLAQAVLETGHFKSDVLKENNNLFGFYDGHKYLKFETLFKCCQFYREWQIKHYSSGDYYVFLNEYGYSEDSTYIYKLKQIKINV